MTNELTAHAKERLKGLRSAHKFSRGVHIGFQRQ